MSWGQSPCLGHLGATRNPEPSRPRSEVGSGSAPRSRPPPTPRLWAQARAAPPAAATHTLLPSKKPGLSRNEAPASSRGSARKPGQVSAHLLGELGSLTSCGPGPPPATHPRGAGLTEGSDAGMGGPEPQSCAPGKSTDFPDPNPRPFPLNLQPPSCKWGAWGGRVHGHFLLSPIHSSRRGAAGWLRTGTSNRDVNKPPDRKSVV